MFKDKFTGFAIIGLIFLLTITGSTMAIAMNNSKNDFNKDGYAYFVAETVFVEDVESIGQNLLKLKLYDGSTDSYIYTVLDATNFKAVTQEINGEIILYENGTQAAHMFASELKQN